MEELDYVRVVLVDMPTTIHGYTVCDSSDFYTVALNSRLSSEMQKYAYDHELSHIINGDFSRMQDANRDLQEEISADELEKIRHI